MRVPKVYVCHPFSEYTIAQEKANKQSSEKVALKIQKRGLMTFNPLLAFGPLTPSEVARYDNFSLNRKDFMRECFAEVEDSDAIYLCDGWEESRGCRREMRLAKNLGKVILPNEEALDRYANRFQPSDV